MPTNLRITTTHGDIRIVEAIRDMIHRDIA